MISDLPRPTLSKATLDMPGGQVWLLRRLQWYKSHLKGLTMDYWEGAEGTSWCQVQEDTSLPLFPNPSPWLE